MDPLENALTIHFSRRVLARDDRSVYVVLLAAFSHAFFLVLYGLVNDGSDPENEAPDGHDPTTAFTSFGHTILSMFRLMIGDFENLFEK